MNYDQARQVDPSSDRPDAGKWRYTRMNDRQVYAIGSCSPFDNCPDCDGMPAMCRPGRPVCTTCEGRGLVDSANPCPGHDTPEEAERHYYEWESDHLHEVTFKPRTGVVDGRSECEAMVPLTTGQTDEPIEVSACLCPTLAGLEVDGGMDVVKLCDAHRNREGWMSARPFTPGMVSIHS